jgi:hypothetical protein
VARYRERHGSAGAKSDPGDAHVLAELVPLDRAHHRPVAGDLALAEHVKVVTRTHQSLIWYRQRQTNALRSMRQEFYPAALTAFGKDLASREALAILALAPSPEEGRQLSLSKIAACRRGSHGGHVGHAADASAALDRRCKEERFSAKVPVPESGSRALDLTPAPVEVARPRL